MVIGAPLDTDTVTTMGTTMVIHTGTGPATGLAIMPAVEMLIIIHPMVIDPGLPTMYIIPIPRE